MYFFFVKFDFVEESAVENLILLSSPLFLSTPMYRIHKKTQFARFNEF